MIPIAKPNLGEEEKQAVARVLDSGMITVGEVVDDFQTKFAQYIGAAHGIATSSGTTALEVALRAVGIGSGDKVLTTPFSFIASTNAIVYVGGIPVFADIDPVAFNISPASIEAQLKKDPEIKALLIVHLFGHPCDIDEIMALVKKYGIALIEDCAQAHGALYKGKKAGSFGDVSAFSFYPTKNMTTSEGGMVVTNNKETADKSRLLINHGMSVRYYHDIVGYNYRMTNIAAAIGLCQLKKLDGFNKRRNQIARYYNENIDNRLVVLPAASSDVFHCFHQYSILVGAGKRDDLLAHLQSNNIGYGVFYPLSIPEQACYASYGFDTDFPVTNRIKNQVVSIPVHPLITDTEMEQVAEAVNRFA